MIEEIDKCPDLEYFNLEENTVEVEAAKVRRISRKASRIQQGFWKNMFTGRMKMEIPKALEFLGNGLVKAGACLTELDLSDNLALLELKV